MSYMYRKAIHATTMYYSIKLLESNMYNKAIHATTMYYSIKLLKSNN